MEQKNVRGLSSAILHLLAMALMLCDHIGQVFFPEAGWFTDIGRLAFPIFAFMLVEGYFHTKNIKKYILRIFIFAILAEVPFDLVFYGTPFFLLHQNVLWGFLYALLLICWNQRAKASGNVFNQVVVGCASLLAACILGLFTFVDYYHYGVLTVLVFYLLRGKKWWNYVLQLVFLGYINLVMMGGTEYYVTLFGWKFPFPQQGFALLSLIPIWLYQGKQGYHSKAFQYFCYAFYPAHLLILWLIDYLF